MITTRLFLTLAFALWLIASISGMSVLWNHQTQPGSAARAPLCWPIESRLPRNTNRTTMLVWIHPQCPCSRATIAELDRLLVHLPTDFDCQVVLTKPAACDAQFVESDLTHAIRQLPGVVVTVDDQQHEAIRFGVSTSGQVLLYGKNSECQFAGGITPGRGHEGDSVGSATLREMIRTQRSAPSIRPDAEPVACSVFGCELFSSELETVALP